MGTARLAEGVKNSTVSKKRIFSQPVLGVFETISFQFPVQIHSRLSNFHDVVKRVTQTDGGSLFQNSLSDKQTKEDEPEH